MIPKHFVAPNGKVRMEYWEEVFRDDPLGANAGHVWNVVKNHHLPYIVSVNGNDLNDLSLDAMEMPFPLSGAWSFVTGWPYLHVFFETEEDAVLARLYFS